MVDGLASSSADRIIKLWTMPALGEVEMFGDQPDVAVALAFREGALTAGRMNGTIQTWALDRELRSPQKDLTEDALVSRPAVREIGIEEAVENEPNDSTKQAQSTAVPVEISGKIGRLGDVDLFQFHASAGEEWTLEINAGRSDSKLDSRLEVLDEDGQPVERVVLQAIRDSWFTFRGKGSETSGDFRLQNWREMELNEYLFANGGGWSNCGSTHAGRTRVSRSIPVSATATPFSGPPLWLIRWVSPATS